MGRKKIPNLTIKIHEGIDFNEVSQNEHVKEIVYSSVFEGIQEAAQGNKKEATILELNSSGAFILIPKENWNKSLEKAKEFYIQSEDYETCALIQKLIESINSYGTKRLSRTASRANKSNNRD
jgi:Rps23 Pro-64 3,4-dihydroxylase Tpa1-like proline 4-hydroxylase